MKPVKLIVSAFGPYADTMPEIEFDRFEDVFKWYAEYS